MFSEMTWNSHGEAGQSIVQAGGSIIQESMPDNNSKLVYSTDPETRQFIDEKNASSRPEPGVDIPPERQQVTLKLDRSGRKGKVVTQVIGLQHTTATLEALARQLKQACSSGGTVKDHVIEIQGDKRNLINGKLTALGYRVRIT
ncbi:MAG: translation initiation factor [Candidatus Zhuqueibacterota bacterium]